MGDFEGLQNGLFFTNLITFLGKITKIAKSNQHIVLSKFQAHFSNSGLFHTNCDPRRNILCILWVSNIHDDMNFMCIEKASNDKTTRSQRLQIRSDMIKT